MFTATADLGEFRREVARTKNELAKACYESAKHAAQEGRDEAKRVGAFKDQTGNLRRNIRAEHGSLEATGGSWDIVAPTPYALFVEGGTSPHPIWPKAGHAVMGPLRRGQGRRSYDDMIAGGGARRFLRFEIGGRVIFARSVKHPGGRPYPFMGPAHIKAEAALYARLETELGRIAAGWS